MNRPPIRIGDVEREGAAWALGEHYALGRLTQEEYDERAGRAWQARTHAELAPLFGDLPQPHGRPVSPSSAVASVPTPAPRRPQRRSANVWLLLLVALFVLGAVTEAPWLLVPVVIVAVVLHKHGRHRPFHGARR